jgi:hypothetical protein
LSFLTFVDDKTLAGEERAIKGYTIATQALGRGDDFDPQSDPIVRVEAGRLRRALDAYYAGEGAQDPLRIVIPRGGYVPHFEVKDPRRRPRRPRPPKMPNSPLLSRPSRQSRLRPCRRRSRRPQPVSAVSGARLGSS